MTSENSCYIVTCPVKLLLEKAVKRNVTYNCVIFSVLKAYIFISHRLARYAQFGQLDHVHGKHEVVGSNPTRAKFLYGIEKP